MYLLQGKCNHCNQPIYKGFDNSTVYSCKCLVLSDPLNGVSVKDLKIIPGIVLMKGKINEELRRKQLPKRIY